MGSVGTFSSALMRGCNTRSNSACAYAGSFSISTASRSAATKFAAGAVMFAVALEMPPPPPEAATSSAAATAEATAAAAAAHL